MKTPLLSPWTQCAEGGHQVLRQDALGFPYLGLFPGLAVLPADNIHSPFALSWDFCMRKWAPCHSVVAAPLLIAFKLLLCIYLESIRGIDHSPLEEHYTASPSISACTLYESTCSPQKVAETVGEETASGAGANG
ncbi:hypothetical protein EJB05_51622 [Eragrostis curvula]|uniref:Uncharacterized protein n=1 Tax=Eragrostis curvula TaxID=38414 RepID=A0A5J9SV30_9POAL|nr:hypothetical protein EJB05_51622 [Eragrostis curvula]